MFRNYFLTAWRNLTGNKSYSALNILGLSVGMAIALLIGLWVQYQYSFDRSLPNYQQVFQARQRFFRNGDPAQMMATPLPLSKVLLNDIPEIKNAVHTDWMGTHNLAVGDHKIFISGTQAEDGFFSVFPYPVIKGELTNALREPYSIVLTESTAHSLFGDTEPIGKPVRIDNVHDLIVKAVIRDLPPNSTFNLHFVVPFSYNDIVNEWVQKAETSWDYNSWQTFFTLQPNVTYAQIEPKLKLIFKKYSPADYKIAKGEVFAQPMADWHLYSNFRNGRQDGGFIDYVHLFSLIGILVLLIACINFMNLATARSEKRAREVGVRKAIGSRRQDLILQFLLESLVITFVAGALSVLLVLLALPSFNTLTNCSITIPFAHPGFWAIITGYVFITGLLAGSRPAFYLSSFQPVKVLKGTIQAGRAATLPRKILVVLQFTCSIALIIGTLLIYQQIQYAKDRPAGYDSNRLVLIDGNADLTRGYPALKHELLQSKWVASVTKSSSPITEIWNWMGVKNWSGRFPNEQLGMATVSVADDYFSTLRMKLVSGKIFSGNFAADSTNVILNQAAVKRMRYKEPLGQTIEMYEKKLKVIGVVEDALMLSPFDPAEPTFFYYDPNAENIALRMSSTADIHEAIAGIGAIVTKYDPAYPFTYHFADDSYAQKFHLEELVGRVAALFAGLAIFISCLGLFGLAAYTAERRTREIGIRKVLGASVAQLWLMLSKDFILLVLISCMIASPVAYYFLHGWLMKYDYRITIGINVFVIASATALFITALTVSWQAIRGAMANPTQSLRSE
jgi:ABC-type antimicrobial peptide transport system permease subunit